MVSLINIILDIFRNRICPKINFNCYRPVSLHISKTANIDIQGSLDFNVTQTPSLKNKTPGYVSMSDNSSLVCKGNFTFSSGCRLGVMKNAQLTLGSGYINYDSKIYCFNKIEIGQNVAISENVIIRDSDNHTITGQRSVSAPIKICDNVWIGMNATILKGVTVGEGSVVSAGSVVTKDVPAHTLVGGVPAKVLRSDIEWNI